MAHSEHLANVMVERFIAAVQNGLDLVPFVADSTSTSKIKPFMEAYPDRIVNVGIAEQTMVGAAAGMALAGKVTATCNAAPFLVSRANEQVRIDVCYNKTNVKMFGLNAGMSYGPLASTHHAVDDISVMRGFGNVEIFAPSCPLEAKQIIDYALHRQGPVYIRLDGKALPQLHDESYAFVAGRIDMLRQGQTVAVVALGSTVHEAVEAGDRLAAEGCEISVIALPSIRPLDRQALAQALGDKTIVLTVEEHNINGGVGSIVAEVLSEQAIGARLYRFGVPDGGYAIAGDRAATRASLGIDAASIVDNVKRLKP
ncbi:MAG: transketolase family protein [Desulfopila sp.]